MNFISTKTSLMDIYKDWFESILRVYLTKIPGSENVNIVVPLSVGVTWYPHLAQTIDISSACQLSYLGTVAGHQVTHLVCKCKLGLAVDHHQFYNLQLLL